MRGQRPLQSHVFAHSCLQTETCRGGATHAPLVPAHGDHAVHTDPPHALALQIHPRLIRSDVDGTLLTWTCPQVTSLPAPEPEWRVCCGTCQCPSGPWVQVETGGRLLQAGLVSSVLTRPGDEPCPHFMWLKPSGHPSLNAACAKQEGPLGKPVVWGDLPLLWPAESRDPGNQAADCSFVPRPLGACLL